jgi:hypothetical protein
MKRVKQLLRQGEFQLFVAVLCVLVFSWPFFAQLAIQHPWQMFQYLFIPWGLVILLLLGMSVSYEAGSPEGELAGENEKHGMEQGRMEEQEQEQAGPVGGRGTDNV